MNDLIEIEKDIEFLSNCLEISDTKDDLIQTLILTDLSENKIIEVYNDFKVKHMDILNEDYDSLSIEKKKNVDIVKEKLNILKSYINTDRI